MQMKQVGSLRRTAQAGFTLIELIVVIVILGILAATALPKFADMGGDARVAKMNGAKASIAAASAMFHGKWLTGGTNAEAKYDVDGSTTQVTVNKTGFVAASSIAFAAGLSSDYNVGSASGSTITISADTGHAKCLVTYDDATGTVTAALDAADCK